MPKHHSLPDPAAQVPPIYARLLRMLLKDAAVDADSVLDVAGLDWDRLIRDDRHLSRETVIRLAKAATIATRKPWLGLDLGSHAPVSAHGVVGYAMLTARDLAQALEVLGRYGAVRHDALSWSYHSTADGGEVQALERTDWGSARTQVTDTVVAIVLRIVQTTVGQLPAGLQVDLPLPKPPWAAQYERFAPVEVRFGQPVLAFRADAAALALPCIGADARAHEAACRECAQALAQLGERSVAQHVASLLANAPAGTYPRLDEVAAACGLAPRTFMRRLRAEGTSFQALLDEARRGQALSLLQRTRLSVEEIAARLGYVDTSNFSRTVRRWFGMSSRELRRHPSTPGDEGPKA